MDILKAIGAVVLSLVMMISGLGAAGIWAVDRSLSDGNISEALDDSGIAAALTEEVLSDNTVNDAGVYGEIIKAAMKTDAMNDFLAAYVVTAARGEIYGEQYEEIGEDDLMNAFNEALDEVKAEGTVMMSSQDGEIIKQMMIRFVPDITADINTIIDRYNSTRTDVADEEEMDQLRTMLGWGPRLGALLIWAGCGALLYLMYRRSGAGLLWCAGSTGAVALIMGAVASLGPGFTITSSAGDVFIAGLIAGGLRTMAIVSVVIAAVFTGAYAVLRIRRRRMS